MSSERQYPCFGFRESTVNLRCPIVIQLKDRTAVQVILEGSPYHMRHRLGDFSHRGGASSC